MGAQDRFGARGPNTTSHGRQFDEATIEAVWRKGTPEPGYGSFRKDACNASMQRGEYGNTASSWGWEIDHIKPVAKGGGDELGNLQPLQWANNRYKGDDFPQWHCKITS